MWGNDSSTGFQVLDRTVQIKFETHGEQTVRRRLAALFVLGVGVLAFAVFAAGEGIAAKSLMSAGLAMLATGVGYSLFLTVQDRYSIIAAQAMHRFIEKDVTPTFVSDQDGAVLARNASADSKFPAADTVAGALRSIFANPSAVLYRLQCRASLEGAAREDIVSRNGHIRLAVHHLGESEFLWRVEEMAEKSQMGSSTDSLPVPMVAVGRSGTLLYMNDAARHLIGNRAKTLDRLFTALPIVPNAVNVLTTDAGPVSVMVVEHVSASGRKELFFLPSGTGDQVDEGMAFEILPVAMVKMNAAGRILRVNKLASQFLGNEVTEKTYLSQLMNGLGRPIEGWLQDMAAGLDTKTTEFLRLARRDREVFVQVTLGRIIEDGSPKLIAVLNDATELKTLEAQFVQGQKMQAIGQLAGGVAHDFNNLLTAISGHCDLLLLRHDQGDNDYADLMQINQNANRAAALVSQLLAFSRKQTLRPEVLDLHDTLSDLTHLLNRLVGEKVTLTLSHNPLLKPIRADKRQLEQVLMNLVVNARDAMPDGGEVRIETDVVELGETLSRDRANVPAGRYATVKVTDEGVGIPPDQISKVFEPFYTTKRTGEGTGLGLSTAYGIIKQTGGFIFVDSVVGTGTVFTMYFPCFEQEPEIRLEMDEEAPRALPHKEDGVVLLVEDEAPVRAFASRALRLRGYTVIEADSAEQALEKLDDASLQVDVFVTDVIMPGMDGPSWVRKALKDRPGARVVFVSGYSEGVFDGQEEEVPNSVFLPKPFSLNQLTDTVQRQMT